MMPGIVGLISNKNEEKLFDKMCQKLNHFDYKIEKSGKNGIHLGKVHLNYVNNSPQPMFSKDKRFAITMVGEIFSYENIEANQIKDDSKFLLDLFLEKGLDCFSRINGQFSASIYDFVKKKLILISDRFGTRPIYYTFYNNKFFFAPEVKSLILDSFDKKINYDSISDLFHFGHLYGYKTMFENVHQLPEASYLIFQNNKIKIKKYWNYPYYEEAYTKTKFTKKEIENYFEEMQEFMTKAMKRQVAKNNDKILFSLSGGLDSRWVISLADKLNVNPMTAFTMGENNSEDVIYAKIVANKLNAKHSTFSINPNNIWKDGEKFSYISDAMSMIYGPIQGFEPSRSFFRKNEITLSSQMCDAVFGSTLKKKNVKPLINKEKMDNDANDIILNVFNLQNVVNLKSIFQSVFFENIENNYKKTPYKYIGQNEYPIFYYFNLLMNEHGRRGTLGGNIMNNLFYETRMPSYDNDLMTFAYKLPIKLRENQFIYRRTFNKMFSELASIPREGTNLPLDASNLRLNIKSLERKIIGRLKPTPFNKIIQKFNRWNSPSYVSYKEWFRNELKNNMESIVLDKRTLSRGIFDEKGIKNLLNEHHTTEKDNSRLIWQIINLEYFFRNFID
ncbi:MAG: asparagine synthase-related protein [Candidatus Marinimicrobia bacterium]|nr:asparagine synthase-related protein [Candidatus Neomarinimicrobiota bacterium]